MRLRTVSATALCTATVLAAVGMVPASATPATAPAATAAAGAPKGPDFDGDGYTDLAVAAYTATAGGVARAGAVAVTYGSAAGIGKEKASVVSAASEGVPGDPVANDKWGQIQAHGDLDHDGYDDLVIRSQSLANSDRAVVLWGAATGLAGGTVLDLGTPSDTVPVLRSIRIADVDGDGRDDILGSAYRGLDPAKRTWGFGTLRGPFTRDGRPAGVRYRETSVTEGLANLNAVADMTGDGLPDILTVGHLPTGKSAFRVYRNTRTGFALTPGAQELPSKPGFVVPTAAGDFNGDGYEDVAGAPTWSYTNPYGQVYIAYGGPAGLSTTLKPRVIHEDTPGVPGSRDHVDRWGEALAAGDIDKDGYADLVVGAPWKDATDAAGKEILRPGSVTVLRGSANGLTGTGARTITQYTAGVPSSNERLDHFGTAVSVTDGNKDGYGEVYVGGDGEDSFKGRVWKLPGTASGVTGAGATSFGLADLGGPAGGAYFGSGLTG
ncbi:FG-GAP-like repeat-containing protein [Streptomyces sp. NPDC101132]|uniref:FG-GAP-like repeat-containing protein n=1 Tax=Streptomyces sp. NPDC101132 TaxID=3366110 RepID=UPI0038309CD3